MTYISGKKLPAEKKIYIALTKIYGIGITRAQALCSFLNIDKNLKVQNLTKSQILQLDLLIKKSFSVKEDLIKSKASSIEKLIAIKSYRGIRHEKGLPLRGQRTSTNGKTQKKLASKKKRGF